MWWIKPEPAVSIGLGSVIIKTVAQLHRGEAKARNQKNSEGIAVGGEVIINFAHDLTKYDPLRDFLRRAWPVEEKSNRHPLQRK